MLLKLHELYCIMCCTAAAIGDCGLQRYRRKRILGALSGRIDREFAQGTDGDGRQASGPLRRRKQGRFAMTDVIRGPEEADVPPPPPPEAGLKAGSRIADYRIEAQLGRGGMAVVYRALDERLGRPVALKVLAPELAASEEFRWRFVHESRAAAAVDHPNIIPIYDAGDVDGMLFIAMRYVDGGDVASLLARERWLAPQQAMAIIAPIASALDQAHAAG
jgi:serine/threonine protein kinase